MPGLTTDSNGSTDANDWQSGFSHSSAGLVCDICRCMVRKTPGDTSAHLEWHERVGG